MIAGLKQLAVRARARGIKIIGATLTPFENETFLPGAWTPKREENRQAVNAWMRETARSTRSSISTRRCAIPTIPTRMLPIYDCGDHLHPSDCGYCKMGDAIDLALFD